MQKVTYESRGVGERLPARRERNKKEEMKRM